jgi:signal transduction histidine kinase
MDVSGRGWATRGGGRAAGRVLAATLVVAGVLGALLGVWYWRTAVEYRRTAEQAVRMRAAILAMQLVNQIQTQLYTGVEAQFARLDDPTAPAAPERLALVADSLLRCRCGNKPFATWFFRYDLTTGRGRVLGAPRDSAQREARLAAIRATLRGRSAPPTERLAASGHDAAGPWILFFQTVARERDTVVVGVEGDLDSLRGAWEWFARSLQVPDQDRDSVTGAVTVDVLLADSTPIFRYGPARDGRNALATSTWTTLSSRVTVDPAAEARFVPGGVPRLPTLTLVLVGVMGAAILGTGLAFNARAQALAAARAEFTQGVTHELRTPLTQILLFAETLVLDRESTAEGRRAAARAIMRESRRLLHMVENVLRFGTSDRSAGALVRRAQPLAPLITDIVRLAGPLAAVDGARIELILRAAPSAAVDASAVRQILGNLIDNALRHGPAGQTIRVTVEQVDGSARIRVEDQGPGVAPDARDRIFEPYVRLGAGPRHSAGVGLGLSVVRDLASALGGRVWVEDASGANGSGGAAFLVAFPVVDDPGAEP